MEVKNISGNQVLKNSFWKFSEIFGGQFFQLIITVVLARLLSPHDYGLMSLILIATNFLGLFVNSGIGSYLVYLQDIKKQDFLTALVFNIAVAVFFAAMLIGASSTIANFYNAPELTPMIMATSAVLPFGAVSSVYTSYAIKMSMHKSLFYRNMVTVPVSGVIALTMAYNGFGTWALIASTLTSQFLLALIICLTIKINIDGVWKFEFSRLRGMLSYGLLTLSSTMVGFISDNISDLFIGKKINASQLGVYNRGRNFPDIIFSSVNTVIATVLFPAYASYSHDILALKDKCRKSIRLLYSLAFPILFGFSACAPAFVNVVLGEKWTTCIPIIQIVCMYYCFVPYLQTGSQIFLAIGKTKIRVFGELVKMFVTFPLLIILINYGIEGVAVSKFLVGAIMFIYSAILNYIFMKYNIFEMLCDLYKPLLASLVMAAVIYPLGLLQISFIYILILQVILGGLMYLIASRVVRNNDMTELQRILLTKFRKR